MWNNRRKTIIHKNPFILTNSEFFKCLWPITKRHITKDWIESKKINNLGFLTFSYMAPISPLSPNTDFIHKISFAVSNFTWVGIVSIFNNYLSSVSHCTRGWCWSLAPGIGSLCIGIRPGVELYSWCSLFACSILASSFLCSWRDVDTEEALGKDLLLPVLEDESLHYNRTFYE